MNINELFEKIQNEISVDEFNGEFTLQGNCIIWTYDLDNDYENIDIDEEDDQEYCFESMSSEEALREIYQEDLEYLQEFLDENDESDKWTFSEPDVVDKIISFKIF